MKIMGLLNKGGTTVMTKHRTKRPISDPSISALTPASMRQMLLPRAVLDTRIALREFLLAAGMKALLEELEDDRTLLCGPKGRFQDDRRAYRHGHDTGQLVMGGRKVRVLKPRARSVDGGELELPHWRHFSQEDPLDERVQEQILMGISTRDYRKAYALGNIGFAHTDLVKDAVPRLVRMLEQGDDDEREAAAHALGKVGINAPDLIQIGRASCRE